MTTLYPKGLLYWAGHRDGGVRKPFVGSSGRPTGEILRTHLLDKIDGWIDLLLLPNSETPRILLLIGGPGNGKTEAVEYFIEQLDKKLNAAGALIGNFKTEFSCGSEALPSRKATVALKDVNCVKKISNISRIEIVHDATASEPGHRPTQLLVNELEKAGTDSDLLYVACVNRGILSQAFEEVSSIAKEQTWNMLAEIMRVVTLGPKQPNCWPMDKYPLIAVWPMDMESLVDNSAYEKNNTPAHHIFRKALDPSKWIPKEECLAGTSCPFHANQELLSDPSLLDNLIKILRFYEISSGKRWTFRELFSLIPQLLVGHEADFKQVKAGVDPCHWAANQVKIAESHADFFERTKALFSLSTKMYWHALFPRWPDLRTTKKACEIILKKDPSNNGNANDIFRLLGWLKKNESTSIQKLLRDELGDLLDPVGVSGGEIVAGTDLSAELLEELFSCSVEQGFLATKAHLSEVELSFLEWIVRVEDHVGRAASEGNKNLAKMYDEVLNTVRVFACRFVKRSLAVKKGVTKDYIYLEHYAKTITHEEELKNLRKQFRDLIHEDQQFAVSLSSTFGQPLPNRSNDALLIVGQIKISALPPSISEHIPRIYLPYLVVGKHAIPLTYDLFKSLVELKDGLMEASIPTEILALIDGTRARLAGKIVRDADSLDDATFSLGQVKLSLAILGSKISVEERSA